MTSESCEFSWKLGKQVSIEVYQYSHSSTNIFFVPLFLEKSLEQKLKVNSVLTELSSDQDAFILAYFKSHPQKTSSTASLFCFYNSFFSDIMHTPYN